MYNTNLSHEQLKAYLRLLTSMDLLTHASKEYVTTQKGQRFLKAYEQLEDTLKGSLVK